MRMIEGSCAECQWWERIFPDWGTCRLSADEDLEGVADETRQFRVHGPFPLTTAATFGCVQFARDPAVPFALR
jgi:hypothetical protein